MRSPIFRRLHQRFGDRDALISRRKFLRDSALLAAGASLVGCRFGDREGASKPPGDLPRVLVVGGGFAGLACAFELAEAGYRDVLVLEARRRLGGRVHTLTDLVEGKTVEAGASLIGANHGTWQRYAQHFGLELIDITIEPDDAEVPIVLGGRRLPADEAWELYESLTLFEEPLAEASKKVPDGARPWDAPNAAELDGTSLGAWIDTLGLPQVTRELVGILEANNNVRPTAEQSFLAMLSAVAAGGGEAYFTDSEVYRCRGGNHQLTQALERAIIQTLGQDSIRPGTAVARIEHMEHGGGGEGGGLCRVITADGSVYEADHVVCAVPPSVWEKIEFAPALPADLAPTHGPAIKVLAPVASPYWAADGWSQYGLGDGDIAMTWDGTYRQSDAPPAALVGFSGADAAARCLAVPREEREAFFAAQLDAFFPGFAKHSTGKPAFIRWPEDPWTRTGYSSPAPGTVTTVVRALVEGLGPLRFAGEHTSPGFFGFMEGGLSSGVRAARDILRSDGILADSDAVDRAA